MVFGISVHISMVNGRTKQYYSICFRKVPMVVKTLKQGPPLWMIKTKGQAGEVTQKSSLSKFWRKITMIHRMQRAWKIIILVRTKYLEIPFDALTDNFKLILILWAATGPKTSQSYYLGGRFIFRWHTNCQYKTQDGTPVIITHHYHLLLHLIVDLILLWVRNYKCGNMKNTKTKPSKLVQICKSQLPK